MKYKLLIIVALVWLVLLGSGSAWAVEEDVVAQSTTVADKSFTLDRPYYTLSGGWRYTLVHEISVRNTGTTAAQNVQVLVPLMDEETPLYMEKVREQFDPWPAEIRLSDEGVRQAVFYLDELQPGEEAVLTQKYQLDSSSITYVDLLQFGGVSYENDAIAPEYLQSTSDLQSAHPEIVNFTNQAIGEETNPYQKAKLLFSAVHLHMTYQAISTQERQEDTAKRSDALAVLRRGTGVCEDFTNLYVAVLRAAGIPARRLSGYLYLPNEHLKEPYFDAGKSQINLTNLRHTWVEFFVPDLGWVVADPTFTYTYNLGNGEIGKFVDWFYFGEITDNRRYIFFRDGSVEQDQIRYSTPTTSGGNIEASFSGYLLLGNHASLYNDIAGHWAEEDIIYISTLPTPLVQGIGQGLFGVDQPLTRAQLVTALQREKQSPPGQSTFSDITASHWAIESVGAAQRAGWLSGYPDGTFRPERTVTRAELAQLLVDVFELEIPSSELKDSETPLAASQEEEQGEPVEPASDEDAETPPEEDAEELGPADVVDEESRAPAEMDLSAFLAAIAAQDEEQAKDQAGTVQPLVAFRDLGQPGLAWADEAIETLQALGLVEGTGDGLFQPGRAVTRAEFAALISRTLRYVEQLTKPY